ncbi:TlpA family protein disulfide reductase [Olleya sp. R77988]|uniref:TlpA family protein disulfide reductase n=1 Tax=Olleya sp. R77988 TaxID=3093875 RepID=UPI0037C752F7
MKKNIFLFFASLFFLNCSAQEPTQFTETALNDTFIDLDGTSVTFQSILDQHKGKTIVIDIWASWCSDCIKGMPKVQALQLKNKEVVFLFLSLDKSQESWKKGIEKYKVKGQNYFMQSGWKGDFATFVNLDWIPRYMVVDKDQNITVFKAIKVNDKKIKNAL